MLRQSGRETIRGGAVTCKGNSLYETMNTN